MADDYRFDDFNDGSERLVGEQLLGKLTSLVQEYGTQLQEIETALDESLSEVWDFASDPISLYLQAYEQTNILQLVRSDNKIFNKVITVFASLCLEIQQLKELAIRKFYPPLKAFGERGISSSSNNENNNNNNNNNNIATAADSNEGDAQVHFGKILPLLLDLSKFVGRAYEVTKNVVHQLASLYNAKQKLFVNSFKNVHLQTVLDHLSELFIVLMTLDEIIVSNEALANCLTMYKRMVKGIRNDPAKYNTSEDAIAQIEKMLYSVKGKVLDGRIFLNCIDQEYDAPGLVSVTQNAEFRKEFFLDIKALFVHLNAKIGEESETNQRYKFMGLCGIYVFYIILFKDLTDKKFFKSLWEVHKKVPVLHLYGDVVWFPNDFFSKTIPTMVKLIKNPDVPSYQRNYIKQLDKDFPVKCKSLYLQVSIWMVRMESNLANRTDIQNILSTRTYLLSMGLRLAYHVGNLFKEAVSLHLMLGVPLKTTQIRYLCQCVEILKAIQATFHRRSAMIGESISFMVQQLCLHLQKLFMPIKAKLEAVKKISDAKLDILAAVTLAIQMLNGPSTKQRRLILKLCMHVLFQLDFLKDEEVEEIKQNLQKLELICDLQEGLQFSCDCSFMYWSRSMLPAYFMDIYETPQQAHKLQYMFAALRDAVPILKKAVHADPKDFLLAYRTEIEDYVKKYIINPLCRDIETDLRLHIHSHLEVSDRNPWKTGIKDLNRFLVIRPLRLFDRTIDIKAHITHYLDTTFYNLTTVSLNDWKTYGEMRNLASEKFGLSLTEVHLPGQTLEQGIDVLEIMRNIHIFVARYNYNLNNQIFIERTSDNKTLNNINIGHISNSIRTHGIGIMNTTVNFIYQFLRQKFVIFSQFLYDDHIKSRLYRDIRFFKENREQLNNRYPFERATKFNKEIRKLGLTDQKQSYLDQFRNLITEIGNAMGYIRMIRSGGFNYVSNAIKFVPDLQDIVPFEEMMSKEKLSQEATQAAHNLDGAIDCLAKNFAEGTEYFKMLVQVFAEEFRSPQNIHLKNFFIIVPPLAINFVEHILSGKEKLAKKKAGGFFTDDGFAIGVAYILKLLDQYKQFDSLHWFEEVRTRYMEEQKKVQTTVSKQQKEDQQTAVLTVQKLRSYQMEFELLRFSFDGARIFFKD